MVIITLFRIMKGCLELYRTAIDLPSFLEACLTTHLLENCEPVLANTNKWTTNQFCMVFVSKLYEYKKKLTDSCIQVKENTYL